VQVVVADTHTGTVVGQLSHQAAQVAVALAQTITSAGHRQQGEQQIQAVAVAVPVTPVVQQLVAQVL
jgi:hypothetical protein